MGSKSVVGIVMYGEAKEDKTVWKDWLAYAKSRSEERRVGKECRL